MVARIIQDTPWLRKLAESEQPSGSVFGVEWCGTDASLAQRPTSPTPGDSGVVLDRIVELLDRESRSAGSVQGAGHAQMNDGEGLVEVHTRRGYRPLMLSSMRMAQVVKAPFAPRLRFILHGPGQTPRDLGVPALAQMIEDNSSFAHPAELHECSLAIDLDNGAAQRVRPLDVKRHRALGCQPSLDQVDTQGAAERPVPCYKQSWKSLPASLPERNTVEASPEGRGVEMSTEFGWGHRIVVVPQIAFSVLKALMEGDRAYDLAIRKASYELHGRTRKFGVAMEQERHHLCEELPVHPAVNHIRGTFSAFPLTFVSPTVTAVIGLSHETEILPAPGATTSHGMYDTPPFQDPATFTGSTGNWDPDPLPIHPMNRQHSGLLDLQRLRCRIVTRYPDTNLTCFRLVGLDNQTYIERVSPLIPQCAACTSLVEARTMHGETS